MYTRNVERLIVKTPMIIHYNILKKGIFVALSLTLYSLFSFAQHTETAKYRQQLLKYEDSLRTLSYKMINDSLEKDRYSSNYQFIKTFVDALKTPQSFNFGFDSLKTVSILTSGDRRFKIFTWHVMNDNGSYRYYGTIQMNNPDGKLKMFPLVDQSSLIKNPSDTVTSNDKWFGTQYYKIIPVTYNVRIPYYILLGWKGNTVKTTKKVIEVVYFKDDKVHFGMPVFDGNKEKPNQKRIIFEYTRQVSMMLNYLPKEGMIVFDHLAPPDPKMTESLDMYGPDMSYDGFKLVNGRWRFIEDLELKNPSSTIDDSFNDPKKPKKTESRKFIE